MTTSHAQPALAMSAGHIEHDAQFTAFLASMRRRFESVTGPLFVTAPRGLELLFERFLALLPPNERQHYTCNSCRRFMERFGAIVTLSATGEARSIMWDPETAPPLFRAIAAELEWRVTHWPVVDVFASTKPTWGTHSNECADPPFVWSHMALTPPKALIHTASRTQTVTQYVALKHEEHGMLLRALAEFSVDVMRRTHLLFSSEQMFRNEKHASLVEWLLNVHEALSSCGRRERARDNIIWSAVASAPVGWCNVRSGLIGTVFEDVKAGLSIDVIKAKHAAKMDPTRYQRPQAPPAAGNVRQAEKLILDLGAAGALARRFARFDEITPHALWLDRSRQEQRPSGPVFGHLKTKGMPRQAHVDGDLPIITMTWVKFRATVLSDALSIELEVPNGKAPFAALVTAVNPDASPILQWDEPDARNPVSWYLYNAGSLSRDWNVAERAKVTAVCLQPTMWNGEDRYAHHGKAVFFLLEGCRDTSKTMGKGSRPGGGFFPECLRSEYHSVRATLEAYAQTAHIAEIEGEYACGLKFLAGSHDSRTVLRVTTKHGTVRYRLDRWD